MNKLISMSRIRLGLIYSLIIFLCLSAWLVNVFGNYWISIGRDILLVLFIVSSLLEGKKPQPVTTVSWIAFIFIFLSLFSFIHKQDSMLQWLRGMRYLVEPLILFVTLQIFPLEEGLTKFLNQSFLFVITLIIIGGIVDYFWPQLLRYSLHTGVIGSLSQIHLAGTAVRLQSFLAGPNALGLFLLVAILLTPLWKENLPPPVVLILVGGLLIMLGFTYSRSSYIGLLAGLIFMMAVGRSYIKNAHFFLGILVSLTLLGLVIILITKPASLTRTQSNIGRLEQYQRIWNERNQIGLFGRGAGTAGLVSEYAFDNSPNYFSENSYLDVYENVGLFAGLVYIAFWVILIVKLSYKPFLLSKVMAATVFGLAVAGLLIDFYTGQIAIWLTLLFSTIFLT